MDYQDQSESESEDEVSVSSSTSTEAESIEEKIDLITKHQTSSNARINKSKSEAEDINENADKNSKSFDKEATNLEAACEVPNVIFQNPTTEIVMEIENDETKNQNKPNPQMQINRYSNNTPRKLRDSRKRPKLSEDTEIESVTFRPKVVKTKEEIEQEFKISIEHYEEEEIFMSRRVRLKKRKPLTYSEEATQETIKITKEIEEEGPTFEEIIEVEELTSDEEEESFQVPLKRRMKHRYSIQEEAEIAVDLNLLNKTKIVSEESLTLKTKTYTSQPSFSEEDASLCITKKSELSGDECAIEILYDDKCIVEKQLSFTIEQGSNKIDDLVEETERIEQHDIKDEEETDGDQDDKGSTEENDYPTVTLKRQNSLELPNNSSKEIVKTNHEDIINIGLMNETTEEIKMMESRSVSPLVLLNEEIADNVDENIDEDDFVVDAADYSFWMFKEEEVVNSILMERTNQNNNSPKEEEIIFECCSNQDKLTCDEEIDEEILESSNSFENSEEGVLDLQDLQYIDMLHKQCMLIGSEDNIEDTFKISNELIQEDDMDHQSELDNLTCKNEGVLNTYCSTQMYSKEESQEITTEDEEIGDNQPVFDDSSETMEFTDDMHAQKHVLFPNVEENAEGSSIFEASNNITIDLVKTVQENQSTFMFSEEIEDNTNDNSDKEYFCDNSLNTQHQPIRSEKYIETSKINDYFNENGAIFQDSNEVTNEYQTDTKIPSPLKNFVDADEVKFNWTECFEEENKVFLNTITDDNNASNNITSDNKFILEQHETPIYSKEEDDAIDCAKYFKSEQEEIQVFDDNVNYNMIQEKPQIQNAIQAQNNYDSDDYAEELKELFKDKSIHNIIGSNNTTSEDNILAKKSNPIQYCSDTVEECGEDSEEMDEKVEVEDNRSDSGKLICETIENCDNFGQWNEENKTDNTSNKEDFWECKPMDNETSTDDSETSSIDDNEEIINESYKIDQFHCNNNKNIIQTEQQKDIEDYEHFLETKNTFKYENVVRVDSDSEVDDQQNFANIEEDENEEDEEEEDADEEEEDKEEEVEKDEQEEDIANVTKQNELLAVNRSWGELYNDDKTGSTTSDSSSEEDTKMFDNNSENYNCNENKYVSIKHHTALEEEKFQEEDGTSFECIDEKLNFKENIDTQVASLDRKLIEQELSSSTDSDDEELAYSDALVNKQKLRNINDEEEKNVGTAKKYKTNEENVEVYIFDDKVQLNKINEQEEITTTGDLEEEVTDDSDPDEHYYDATVSNIDFWPSVLNEEVTVTIYTKQGSSTKLIDAQPTNSIATGIENPINTNLSMSGYKTAKFDEDKNVVDQSFTEDNILESSFEEEEEDEDSLSITTESYDSENDDSEVKKLPYDNVKVKTQRRKQYYTRHETVHFSNDEVEEIAAIDNDISSDDENYEHGAKIKLQRQRRLTFHKKTDVPVTQFVIDNVEDESVREYITSNDVTQNCDEEENESSVSSGFSNHSVNPAFSKEYITIYKPKIIEMEALVDSTRKLQLVEDEEDDGDSNNSECEEICYVVQTLRET